MEGTHILERHRGRIGVHATHTHAHTCVLEFSVRCVTLHFMCEALPT